MYTAIEGTAGFDSVCIQATGVSSFEAELIVGVTVTDDTTGVFIIYYTILTDEFMLFSLYRF